MGLLTPKSHSGSSKLGSNERLDLIHVRSQCCIFVSKDFDDKSMHQFAYTDTTTASSHDWWLLPELIGAFYP